MPFILIKSGFACITSDNPKYSCYLSHSISLTCLYLISILQKLKHNDAAAMDANEILKAATVGSARCMGLDNYDCIAEGKLADLTVIDLNRPNMQPINNITKNLVYSGSKDDVKMTVINGKILYENGEFMNIDKEEIYFSAQEVTNRLKK